MTTTKPRYPLAEASRVAEYMSRELRPVCHRVDVAGSIRRRSPDVGDVELVCIPRVKVRMDFFERPYETNCQMREALEDMIAAGQLRRGARFGPWNKNVVHAETGIPIDIFTATEENWGMFLFVRTGPADFIKAAMARFRRLGHVGHAYATEPGAGAVTVDAYSQSQREADCPNEGVVFEHLRVAYLQPWDRKAAYLR